MRGGGYLEQKNNTCIFHIYLGIITFSIHYCHLSGDKQAKSWEDIKEFAATNLFYINQHYTDNYTILPLEAFKISSQIQKSTSAYHFNAS